MLVKTECARDRVFATRSEANLALFGYNDGFYNSGAGPGACAGGAGDGLDRYLVDRGSSLDAGPALRASTAVLTPYVTGPFNKSRAARRHRVHPPRKGAVLRQERLYHSHVKEWRATRDAGALEGFP
ncbi:hypothetical protein ABZ656_53860 [Streptomyces sp. NPDC007095]|jgi:hypothetical protein|uniref:hypothetical protein n=1 Tax=Streptomyces sp. NPDC007095 TaxID=3154482 RepID=UPI000C7136D6